MRIRLHTESLHFYREDLGPLCWGGSSATLPPELLSAFISSAAQQRHSCGRVDWTPNSSLCSQNLLMYSATFRCSNPSLPLDTVVVQKETRIEPTTLRQSSWNNSSSAKSASENISNLGLKNFTCIWRNGDVHDFFANLHRNLWS